MFGNGNGMVDGICRAFGGLLAPVSFGSLLDRSTGTSLHSALLSRVYPNEEDLRLTYTIEKFFFYEDS